MAKKKSRKSTASKSSASKSSSKSSGRGGERATGKSSGRSGSSSGGSRGGSNRSRSSGKDSPTLQELLVVELQEIHSAESQLARIIPRLVKAAEAEGLDAALEERLQEGEQVIQDVDTALEELGASPGRKKNVAAEGLINDVREHVQEIETGPALDTVLIGAMQKTEHYCIAAWGTVKALAQVAGQEDLVSAMERALEEGKAYDERLTQLAEEEVTPKLQSQDAEGTEGGDDGDDSDDEEEDDADSDEEDEDESDDDSDEGDADEEEEGDDDDASGEAGKKGGKSSGGRGGKKRGRR